MFLFGPGEETSLRIIRHRGAELLKESMLDIIDKQVDDPKSADYTLSQFSEAQLQTIREFVASFTL
jgi:hypothetical protein